MWIHLVTARGFLRRHWPLLTLHVFVAAVLSLSCGVGMAVIAGVDRDLALQTEDVSVDIVLRESVSEDQIADVASVLRRRPDIIQCVHLDRQDVWRIFQSDIGVESEGMAEIAALPQVIRLRFRNEFGTGRHVSDVVRSLRRRMPDHIETVMVPTQTIVDLERQRADLRVSTAALGTLGVLLIVMWSIMMGNRLRSRNHIDVAKRTWRSPGWLRIGPLVGITLGTCAGCILACSGAVLLAPRLSDSYSWFGTSAVVPQMISAACLSAFLMSLIHVAMVIVPSARQRGWQ